MTEQEWLACADPQRMLDWLRGRRSDHDDAGLEEYPRVSDRKLRPVAQRLMRPIMSPDGETGEGYPTRPADWLIGRASAAANHGDPADGAALREELAAVVEALARCGGEGGACG